MTSLISTLYNRFYPGIARACYDILFRRAILRFVQKEAVVLGTGASAGIVESTNFRSLAARVCGIQPNPCVTEDAYFDEAKLAGTGLIPDPDGNFYFVFAEEVIGHLAEPEKVFRGICRLLKPRGTFLFKTPNKSHYMPLIVRFTPLSFHGFVNRLRGRLEIHTFATPCRANRTHDVRVLAERSGLGVTRIDLIECRPEYLRLNFFTYVCGFAYERLGNSTKLLSRFRVIMISELYKRVV
jgi:SAM-dependent methyltransferase